jgi:hypothetical protein
LVYLENIHLLTREKTSNLNRFQRKRLPHEGEKPVLNAEKLEKSKLSLSYMVRDTFSSVSHQQASGGSRSPKGSDTRMGLASLFGTWMARHLNPFHQCLALLTSQSPMGQI